MDNNTYDLPLIGTAIAGIVFLYAWIADTNERKEAFVNINGLIKPPTRTESFYAGPKNKIIEKPYA